MLEALAGHQHRFLVFEAEGPQGRVAGALPAPRPDRLTIHTQVAKMRLYAGFMHVRPLLGGLDAWVAAGYPVELNDPL